MPKIVIVGGRLQGIEAAFLARKAGIYTALIDFDENCIAQKICDEFICGDVLSDEPAVKAALDSADMILPAMENNPALEQLVKLCREKEYILAFDWDAYQVSTSRKKSDAMFAAEGMPCPRYYPEGKLPYIARPDSESGSHGVTKLTTQEELAHGAMKAVGIDNYELVKESSGVYIETLDIVVDGVEIASGAYGPHPLDANRGIFEPWVGIGIGLKRLAMVKGEYQTIKRAGKSLAYVNGIPLKI